MLIFLAKRLSQAVLILFGVTLITFCLSFLMPADPVRMIAGRSATKATVESIRKELGLDKPVVVQYLIFLKNAAVGAVSERHFR